MPAKEPRPASHFRLDLGGRQVVRTMPGEIRWSNITLKRGVDETLDIWKWREQVIQEGPDKSRTNGSVALIDYSGSTIATWSFDQGWPIKYTGATLNAGGNEVAVEE